MKYLYHKNNWFLYFYYVKKFKIMHNHEVFPFTIIYIKAFMNAYTLLSSVKVFSFCYDPAIGLILDFNILYLECPVLVL
jgi:hypothetical protein